MRIVIIGAVAAGTSAAAKARRNDDFAEIVIYERDKDISYSGCGLPYYIGGDVEDINELTPRDPKFFKDKYDIDVKIQHEVISVDSDKKVLIVKNLLTDEIFEDNYDKLVLATGASPFIPKIEGIDKKHVFFLRNVENARDIKLFIEENKPTKAVIAGTGFIGFEVLESLVNYSIDVTIVEVADKITPNLDIDMASFLENTLVKKGIKILKSTSINKILDKEIILSNDSTLDADLVIMATGVRPNVSLAKQMGVKLGVTGAIEVNDRMETSITDVYAAGDCIETFNIITGKPVYRPLGTTANKTGRIAGDALSSGSLTYRGNLSTGIFKLFDLSIGSTGLSEKEAITEGYDVEVVHNIKPNKPSYMNGQEMVIKAIADRKSKRLLGVQIVGYEGVDKRIDVFATLLTYKATVDELFHLDLSYAPPFSTTKDPVHYTGMILENAISNGRPILNSNKIKDFGDEIQIIDTRSEKDYQSKGHVPNAINIPHSKLRNQLDELDKNRPVMTYCNKGTTGNATQNILINHGFKKVYNLSGGHTFYKGSRKK